jgi:hypothetical protein
MENDTRFSEIRREMAIERVKRDLGNKKFSDTRLYGDFEKVLRAWEGTGFPAFSVPDHHGEIVVDEDHQTYSDDVLVELCKGLPPETRVKMKWRGAIGWLLSHGQNVGEYERFAGRGPTASAWYTGLESGGRTYHFPYGRQFLIPAHIIEVLERKDEK